MRWARAFVPNIGGGNYAFDIGLILLAHVARASRTLQETNS